MGRVRGQRRGGDTSSEADEQGRRRGVRAPCDASCIGRGPLLGGPDCGIRGDSGRMNLAARAAKLLAEYEQMDAKVRRHRHANSKVLDKLEELELEKARVHTSLKALFASKDGPPEEV